MYDSITSHLLRLARRSWIIIVASLIAGAVLGAAFATQRQSWTGTATIQLADVSTRASLLGLASGEGFESGDTVRPLTIRSVQDFEATATDTAVAASADEGAAVIVAVATGPSQESVSAALVDFEQIVERRATDPRVDVVDSALESNNTSLARFEADLEARNEQLASLDVNDPIRDAVAQSRGDLEGDIRELESASDALRQYQEFLQTDLVTTISNSVDGPGTIVMSMVVGVIVMAILLTLVGAAIVVTDQRVRRRLQLERVLPGVPILAVLAKSAWSSEDAREAARSIDRFAEKTNRSRALMVSLKGSNGDATVSELQPLTTVTLGGLDDDSSFDDSVFILLVQWGRTTENEVAARVASLETAGDGPVALIVVGVPPRDLDWAGASGRGAESPVLP